MTGKDAALFASTGLVARIERAECGLILAGAESVRRRDPESVVTIPLAGGSGSISPGRPAATSRS